MTMSGRRLNAWAVGAIVTIAALGPSRAHAEPAVGEVAAPDPIAQHEAVQFFETSVRPLLAANCYECHGPDKQKGGLRLDARKTALSGGVSGNTILPGKSADSVLIHRLKGHGGEDRMPLNKPPLSDTQIATIAARESSRRPPFCLSGPWHS